MNVPSAAAVPAIVDPLASLRASSVVRAWVLPLMTTALPLTTAFFLGDVTVSLGGAASNTYRTATDGSDSPPGPKIGHGEVVDALGQLDRDDRLRPVGDGHVLDRRGALVGQRQAHPQAMVLVALERGRDGDREVGGGLAGVGLGGCSIDGGSAGMRSDGASGTGSR